MDDLKQKRRRAACFCVAALALFCFAACGIKADTRPSYYVLKNDDEMIEIADSGDAGALEAIIEKVQTQPADDEQVLAAMLRSLAWGFSFEGADGTVYYFDGANEMLVVRKGDAKSQYYVCDIETINQAHAIFYKY